MEKFVQQGDVLFFREEMPGEAKKSKPRNGLWIFAEGEATGHHHSCAVCDDVTLFEDSNGTLYCDVKKETTVTHQEHKPVTLEPGTYRIGIVREVDPFEQEIRSVQD